jgi:hypothetical protein
MSGKIKKEVVRQTLEALAKDGTLTPTEVLDAARNPDSLIHECFEWDDEKAADSHRLSQARALIRSVDLVIIEETRILSTVAYVRDPDAEAKEQGYAATVALRDDEDRARRVLLNEADRAAAYLERVRSLACAFGLEDEMGAIQERFVAFRESVATE